MDALDKILLNNHDAKEIYLFANTPAYLFKNLVKSDIVCEIISNIELGLALRKLKHLASIQNKHLDDLANCYVLVLSILQMKNGLDALRKSIHNNPCLLGISWVEKMINIHTNKLTEDHIESKDLNSKDKDNDSFKIDAIND